MFGGGVGNAAAGTEHVHCVLQICQDDSAAMEYVVCIYGKDKTRGELFGSHVWISGPITPRVAFNEVDKALHWVALLWLRPGPASWEPFLIFGSHFLS